MNENLNLVEILKDCPKGTKLYSTIFGEVKLYKVKDNNTYPIGIEDKEGAQSWLTSNGKFMERFDGECIIFPSREQRNWDLFTVPDCKKGKFDPNTLKPFDKVLVRDSDGCRWRCAFYSHTRENKEYKYMTMHLGYKRCIPYNNDTEHLLDTTEEAPEYYRHWED